MNYYPIFLDIKNEPVLVVGGGSIAIRKIRLMLSANADITVVAAKISTELKYEFDNKINYCEREFNAEDINGYRLITAATNNLILNKKISNLAKSKNIPVNVVDDPNLCSFITPSIIDRSPLIIAISTGGGAPVLARQTRAKVEAFIPNKLGLLAQAMQKYRNKIKSTFNNEKDRKKFWETFLTSPSAEQYLNGNTTQANLLLEKMIDQSADESNYHAGHVSLIGAGPGDPDLLTFRALRLMQSADIVLYDRLVSKAVLNLCRRDADRIYVGKRKSDHTFPQDQINQKLIDLAKQGNHVVRLKGGDPFIFGRGGEEIELLAQNNIQFQVVPGITAATGCATYAGIPLTHRDYAQSCVFVTAHIKEGKVDLNWQNLVYENQTIVIYMGLNGISIICEKLIDHGANKDLPIAIIEQGTKPEQRVFTGSLSTIQSVISNKNIVSPALIIIGNVVKLQSSLSWYNNNKTDNNE